MLHSIAQISTGEKNLFFKCKLDSPMSCLTFKILYGSYIRLDCAQATYVRFSRSSPKAYPECKHLCTIESKSTQRFTLAKDVFLRYRDIVTSATYMANTNDVVCCMVYCSTFVLLKVSIWDLLGFKCKFTYCNVSFRLFESFRFHLLEILCSKLCCMIIFFNSSDNMIRIHLSDSFQSVNFHLMTYSWSTSVLNFHNSLSMSFIMFFNPHECMLMMFSCHTKLANIELYTGNLNKDLIDL